jgi:cytochrome c peroxidase
MDDMTNARRSGRAWATGGAVALTFMALGCKAAGVEHGATQVDVGPGPAASAPAAPASPSGGAGPAAGSAGGAGGSAAPAPLAAPTSAPAAGGTPPGAAGGGAGATAGGSASGGTTGGGAASGVASGGGGGSGGGGSSGSGSSGSGGGGGASGDAGGGADGGDGLAPLATVPVPQPVGGDLVDQVAAVRLGKALFWDMQAGSDGQQACATCHFHAGADSRRVDILHPGPNGAFETGGVTSAGQVLPSVDISSDDRAGSSGVLAGTFRGLAADPTVAADVCDTNLDRVFGGNRQVTGRNAPSVVGAVFNRDNFWDGRGNHLFNGRDPFGAATGAGPYVQNASLASQTVGPALSAVEMSCAGRAFDGQGGLGAKLMARPPLQLQRVSPSDSVLGAISAWPAPGLTVSYADLVAAAFGPAAAAGAMDRFGSLWGQAIQAYESTLVPDRTPLDRFLAGDGAALTASQQRGLDVFRGKGGCTKCHAGPELTDASVAFAAAHGLVNEDGGDQGFHNLGVRPTAEDPGRAGKAPTGASLSVSGAAADRGAFKTPGLRNVGLTAPYFHNGGKATLASVVDFYDRGGDFANPEKAHRLQPLGLGASDETALVDFLQDGLTDCRTAAEAAPFDHPSIDLPNGPSLQETGATGTMPCP